MGFVSLVLVLVFQDMVSLCSPSWPETHSVDQAGFKLSSTCLCLPSAGIKGVCHHLLAIHGILFLRVMVSWHQRVTISIKAELCQFNAYLFIALW